MKNSLWILLAAGVAYYLYSQSSSAAAPAGALPAGTVPYNPDTDVCNTNSPNYSYGLCVSPPRNGTVYTAPLSAAAQAATVAGAFLQTYNN